MTWADSATAHRTALAHASRQERRVFVVARLVPLLRDRGPTRLATAAKALGVHPTYLGKATAENPMTIRRRAVQCNGGKATQFELRLAEGLERA